MFKISRIPVHINFFGGFWEKALGIMKRRDFSKIIAIVALTVSVICTSIVYAMMSTMLSINGESKIEAGAWEVKFSNLSKPTINGSASIDESPVLSDTSISGFDLSFSRPGDSVTYTFDVVNNGTMNAKIGTFTKAIPTFLSVSVTPEKLSDENLVKNNFAYSLTYIVDRVAVGVE